ncbi:MAG: DNA repair protein RecN [Gammaproteobacteria bacterium]|nr:DNA repair protein RecN [Gammaproteobacteria bacterium]
MLTHIDIRNFAIVDHVELDLTPGMTVLTGETGAGKSILVDALGLILGERAGANTVRHGMDKAELSASFDIQKLPRVRKWLSSRDLDPDDAECVLRRSITTDGRSRSFINGRPAPLQGLRELGNMLVDIHGQHAHHSLLKRDIQREILDDFAQHGELLAEIASLYQHWQSLQQESDSMGGSRSERSAEMDLLRYQLQELQVINLGTNEVEELNEEFDRLNNVGRLREGAQRAYQAIYGEESGSALTLLESSRQELEELLSHDEHLGEIVELLGSTVIQVGEAATDLRRYTESVELDPERLGWVEQRLTDVHQLARKHRVKPDELLQLQDRLTASLQIFEGGDERRRELEAEITRARDRYGELSNQLHTQREAAALELAGEVSRNMHGLGMPGGRFRIDITGLPDNQPSVHGRDRVEFQVSTNPGQPVYPMNKVASGGELSRISLAIQVLGARGGSVTTLIFDEVDVGIGGGVAEIVGQQLRTLGRSSQVLCITHLPQVASQGQNHLRVRKKNLDGATVTRIGRLSGDKRVKEIARMLGGIKITGQTLAHAREMIERAKTTGNR